MPYAVHRNPRAAALDAVLAGAWALAGAAGAQDAPPPPRLELRDVHVATRNVYSDQDAEDNWFYALFNAVHWPTDPEVIRRELWFGPGEQITTLDAEELERNLRRMRLFGDVETEIEDLGDGRADLNIKTRDRLSLVLRGSASLIGGTTKFNASIGEVNLFGTGKRIVLSGSREEGNDELGITYSDPQLFGSWHRLTVSAGDTDEGPFAAFDFSKPFKHLTDPISYGTSFSSVDRAVDYFAGGEAVAAVPERRIEANAFAAHGFGPRLTRWAVGGDMRVRSSDYSPATGPAAGDVRVPGDTDEFQIGPYATVDHVTEFLKVTHLDTIDFVQDLELGIDASLRTSFVLRDEEGVGTEPQGLVHGSFRSAAPLATDTLFTTYLAGSVRFDADRAQGYAVATALHVYQTSLPYQTLAASVTYDQVFERQDLQPQLTLGEDNGLRGYPAREFGGTRRTRLNIEDRIFTDLEVLSVDVGLAAFFDVGWMHGPAQGLYLDDAYRAVGVGLRLGSSELFGGRVLRVDVAWPLDDRGSEEFDMSISVAAGQVFTFFGNSSELTDDFAGIVR